MAGNSFGTLFKISSFGESHGPAIGVVIDGCPPGIAVSTEMIQAELDRRKPGQSAITTQRQEHDTVEILSGVFEGKSTGTPIALLIRNKDAQSKDYSHLKDTYRPSHADFTYSKKFGIRDYRGGGRSSARETAMRVAAGAIAKQILNQAGVSIHGFVSRVKDIAIQEPFENLDLSQTEQNIVRCPDQPTASKMIALIEATKERGDTVGGIVSCVVKKCPAGLGEPVFDKLHAQLGKAMLSINAVKGFEIGSGFSGTYLYGSEHNDTFTKEGDNVVTETNHSGGVQGGISNGMDISFNVAFKPVATIMKEQRSVDKDGNEVLIEGKGRHDPCVLPRAVPIVEAMTALVIVDFYLLQKSIR